MYPPRDRSVEVYQPPTEFKTAVVFGFIYFCAAVGVTAMAGGVKGHDWWFIMAALCWIEAALTRTRLRKGVRLTILVACAAMGGAIDWFVRTA